MNCCVPDFALEDDDPISPSSLSCKTPISTEEDLVELLWWKGPVLRRISPEFPHSDSALPCRMEPAGSSHSAATVAASELFMLEDEMASWFYRDDEGGGELISQSQAGDADRRAEVEGFAGTGLPPLPPPEMYGELVMFSRAEETEAAVTVPSRPPSVSRESTAVDSSETADPPRGQVPESRASSGGERRDAGMCERGLTSLSVVSCERAGAAKAHQDERKRKARSADDSECHSEGVEFESSNKKDARRSSPLMRRTRASEVHNLSERRRRDRINEKMKALQQLIPWCNKTDKASMLDDAIEYLKSLKMQVQMMSMGCNMTPVMFPGIQQYMPPMGMGMEMGTGGLSRPVMLFPPVMAGSHMAAPAAAHVSQSLPMQTFNPPAVAHSEQLRVQAAGRRDPRSNLAYLRGPNVVRIHDPYHRYLGLHHLQFHPQNQAMAEPGTSKGTNMPENSKIG